MALLFMEGWEGFNNNADLREDSRLISASTTNDSYITITTGRIDGQALSMPTTAPSIYYQISPSTTDTYYVGMAVHQGNYGYNNDILRTYYGSLSSRNNMRINTNGTITVYRGSTNVLGTTTATVPLNTWNYIVLKIKLSDTVGTVELWLNGIKELDLTGLDTNPDTGTDINAVRLNAYYTVNKFDDLYIGDTSGSDMNDQVGDVHIEMVSTDADGTTNNWTRLSGTANYEMVDEGANSDDDTTYVYSSTATDKELYGCAALTGSIDTIYAVQSQIAMRKEGAGYRTANLIIRSNTTESDGSEIGLATDYKKYSMFLEKNPDGGVAWTETTVNAAEIGVEIAS